MCATGPFRKVRKSQVEPCTKRMVRQPTLRPRRMKAPEVRSKRGIWGRLKVGLYSASSRFLTDLHIPNFQSSTRTYSDLSETWNSPVWFPLKSINSIGGVHKRLIWTGISTNPLLATGLSWIHPLGIHDSVKQATLMSPEALGQLHQCFLRCLSLAPNRAVGCEELMG